MTDLSVGSLNQHQTEYPLLGLDFEFVAMFEHQRPIHFWAHMLERGSRLLQAAKRQILAALDLQRNSKQNLSLEAVVRVDRLQMDFCWRSLDRKDPLQQVLEDFLRIEDQVGWAEVLRELWNQLAKAYWQVFESLRTSALEHWRYRRRFCLVFQAKGTSSKCRLCFRPIWKSC